MARKPRINYTETDKALMWDRWQKGESLESIAQLFDRTHGSLPLFFDEPAGYAHRSELGPGERCQWLSVKISREVWRPAGRSVRSQHH